VKAARQVNRETQLAEVKPQHRRHNREENDQNQSNDVNDGSESSDMTEDSSSGAERLFSYEQDGLSYTVRVFENEDGSVSAEITVDEGSMDLNAVYYSSEDYDGPSENLGGPLNMNGGGSQFEGGSVSWEGATAVSQPGLGPDGEDKPSFLSAGESFTVDLDADSLDEIDLIGIRATSVNGGDSIKGVSGNPEEPDEPDQPDDPDEPDATYPKVFFVSDLDSDGGPTGGLAILGPDETPFSGVNQLDSEADGTFADYVAFLDEFGFPEIEEIESIIFYEGTEPLEEAFRIDAPEGGFEDSDAILSAYQDATADIENQSFEDLFIAMTVDEDEVPEDDDSDDEEEEAFI